MTVSSNGVNPPPLSHRPSSGATHRRTRILLKIECPSRLNQLSTHSAGGSVLETTYASVHHCTLEDFSVEAQHAFNRQRQPVIIRHKNCLPLTSPPLFRQC